MILICHPIPPFDLASVPCLHYDRPNTLLHRAQILESMVQNSPFFLPFLVNTPGFAPPVSYRNPSLVGLHIEMLGGKGGNGISSNKMVIGIISCGDILKAAPMKMVSVLVRSCRAEGAGEWMLWDGPIWGQSKASSEGKPLTGQL